MAFFFGKNRRAAKKRPKCTAVIAAAGLSQRMGGEDKLFVEVCGAPVLAHTLAAFQNCGCIDEIVVVTREESVGPVSELCRKHGIEKAAKVMVGGATRAESVMLGVFAASDKAKLIAIHDGARPCVSKAVIEGAVAAAAKFHAAAPGLPVSSTLKKVSGGAIVETVGREGLFEIQTPQVFDADLIKAALANAVDKGIDVTDDCAAAEIIGASVRVTEGSGRNIKITTGEDVQIAEAILAMHNA